MGRPWTAAEESRLIELCHGDSKHIDEIAAILNRTTSAAYTKARGLRRRGFIERLPRRSRLRIRVWQSLPALNRRLRDMHRRCYDRRRKDFKNYGAKGVVICDEWNFEKVGRSAAYENFSRWALANGYRAGLSIDRIRTAGNYEPSNCRFSSQADQQANKHKPKTSKFIGVHHDRGLWRATVWLNGRKIFLGAFAGEKDAARAFDQFTREHCPNRQTNFPGQ